jgi:hypothetical protein
MVKLPMIMMVSFTCSDRAHRGLDGGLSGRRTIATHLEQAEADAKDGRLETFLSREECGR